MLYIANWKMNMPSKQALTFCRDNYDGFEKLSQIEDKKIILCPSFTEINILCEIFKNTSIGIGAQDCSNEKIGPYTGQISAESLHQVKCTYCIVGHSERRIYCSESNKNIGQKVLRLLESGITPIVCVGEQKIDYDAGIAKDVIKMQLESVFKATKNIVRAHLCIAYEPVWSIGTGIAPDNEYIEEIFDFIFKTAEKYGENSEIKLLYGGSVSEENIVSLKGIKNLMGVLIGGASLDFKKFEKIVQL